MYITFDPSRPCNPNRKNGFTRYELDALANANEIKDHHKMTMDDICQTLKEVERPVSAEVFPDYTSNESDSAGMIKELQLFLREFHDDLTKWYSYSTPSMRMVLAGGFCAKKLLETKYGIYDKILTTDIDITVSIRDSWYSPNQAIRHIENKLRVLQDNIARRRGTFYQNSEAGSGLHWSLLKFNEKHEFNPYFSMHRYAIIVVTLDGGEFADIAITDAYMPPTILDKEASENSKPMSLPIKNTEYLLREFLTLIYMETVKDSQDYAYYIRHPMYGKYPQKGLKDIERARLLCRESKEKRFMKYCNLLANFTVERFKEMPKEEQDIYFENLRKALHIQPQVSDSALGDPKKMDPNSYYQLYPDEV